jgi:hypothetical protein
MPAVASQILGHEPAFLGGRMQPSPPVCCLAVSIHPRGPAYEFWEAEKLVHTAAQTEDARRPFARCNTAPASH